MKVAELLPLKVYPHILNTSHLSLCEFLGMITHKLNKDNVYCVLLGNEIIYFHFPVIIIPCSFTLRVVVVLDFLIALLYFKNTSVVLFHCLLLACLCQSTGRVIALTLMSSSDLFA